MLHLLAQPIAATIARHLGREPAAVLALVGPPAKGQSVDLCLPCFQLARELKRNPKELADELAAVVAAAHPDAGAAAAGPFLNLTLAPAAVAAALIPALRAQPLAPLRSQVGKGLTACVDFSSPNIAKHLAFHHIRSTMIGNSLSRLYAAAGWKVVRINFLGDWGTAFGRLIAGWKREGLTLAQLETAPDRVTFLNELYVRVSQAAKADPAIEDEARRWSKRLEDGDSEARGLWQIFKDASLAEFKRIYALLGVDFDSWKGEAYYEDKMGPVLAELKAKNLTSVDLRTERTPEEGPPGATIVDLPALIGKPFKRPMLVQRVDGGTLYATRDLAAADDRFREFAYDRSLYVVDLGQSLHFQQWFAVAKLLGRPYAERLRHVGFGIVLMWNDEAGDGLEAGWARGRTRGGKVMLLREVLEEAIDRARAVVAEKNPAIAGDEREAIARAVGVGAVVFNDLKNGRTNDVKFKFEEALRFDGETGPYLQFAHARLASIERKAVDHFTAAFNAANAAPDSPAAHWLADKAPDILTGDLPSLTGRADPALLTLDSEKQVLFALAKLTSALERAVDGDEPSVLAQALLALAAAVSGWLTAGNHDENLRVLGPDPAVTAARLALVRAARASLGEGLRLLGLQAPERM